jgi:hypothetical protein
MVLECGWCQLLKLQKLLLEIGNCLCPLLKLDLLHLEGILKTHNRVGYGCRPLHVQG